MFFKSKLLISTLVALPLSVLSFKALSPTFQAIGSASSSVNKNVQSDAQKSTETEPKANTGGSKSRFGISSKAMLVAHAPRSSRTIRASRTSKKRRSRAIRATNASKKRSRKIKVARASRRRLYWRLPWVGATATVTQRWHSDSWGRYKSVDFGLPAGTPVVAPIASRVLSFCNAGRNHLAIRLQAADGNRYSLVHVKSRSVYVNKRYRKGQIIGVIARNTPRNRCARSTGPHLHMSFPRQNFKLGRYWFSRSYIPKRLKP
ncbi:metalloendopeptidase-like membrane protein [Rivularia sp. PCC 7116]|nr:metalloendopeptidase-like membrane protein [Rivularia sp. PCC 7116]